MTPPSLTSARDIGVDVIELDCHLTKDNRIVVAHDNNLYRICGVDRFIFEYDFEVIWRQSVDQGPGFLIINRLFDRICPRYWTRTRASAQRRL